uniref:Uncharacterized protein n=1 Tax=Anopheles culicifacies TaxID=139723 RepID=A0A182MRZ9_9DIPT
MGENKNPFQCFFICSRYASGRDGWLQGVDDLCSRSNRWLMTDNRIESANIVGRIVDDTFRAVRFHRAVLATYPISVAYFLLALDVSRKLITHSVPVAVIVAIVIRFTTILLILVLVATRVPLIVVEVIIVARGSCIIIIRSGLIQPILRSTSQLLSVLLSTSTSQQKRKCDE